RCLFVGVRAAPALPARPAHLVKRSVLTLYARAWLRKPGVLLLQAHVAQHSVADAQRSLDLRHEWPLGLILEEEVMCVVLLADRVAKAVIAPIVTRVQRPAVLADELLETLDQRLLVVAQLIAQQDQRL